MPENYIISEAIDPFGIEYCMIGLQALHAMFYDKCQQEEMFS